ncbi:hypothetical protein [Actinomadura hibisca]|uniref:hypothetical protein n=1 Tax=Actinomadura hibisca TaxID=68565 RepID=UPI00082E6658|nr:hypothetical protein [Actinomadura hibisca]
MADKWLAPDTCGVKLAEFERMTQDMTRAAPQLAELADQLWQALNGAGVSTAPAMEIKRIAAWAREASIDLRRRNELVRAMDREQLAMRVCRADGTYLTLPDRYTDQIGYAEGRRVATLVRKAAAGDARARAELMRRDPADVTPAMAKALVTDLGAKGLFDVTGRLCDQVRAQRGDEALAQSTWKALGVLGRSLALTTDPGRKNGYAGGGFLGDLVREGQGNFPPSAALPAGITGYQALSTLLVSAGDNRFSPEFFKVVGTGMIAHDRHIRETFGNAPLPDLTGRFRDGASSSSAPGEGRDFLVPLLNAAAASGKEGARALFRGAPMGPHAKDAPASMRMGNLEYLLSDRRELWGKGPEADHGAALGEALRVAAAGQDELSQALAFDAGKILADDAKKHFTVKDDKIEIQGEDRLDALSGLRVPAAQVFAVHITKMNDIYQAFRFGAKTGSTPMDDADLDYLLLELTRSADAYDTLLKAQIAHAKVAIDRAAPGGEDKLSNAIIGEGWMFGHLLEARYQTTNGEESRLAEDRKRIEGYVSMGVGFAGGKAVESVASKAPIVGEGFNLVVGKAQDELTKWIVERAADKPNDAILASKTSTEAVEKLFGQMTVASLHAHDRLPESDLKGQTFVTSGAHPKILPIESMSADQFEDFTRWANLQVKLDQVGSAAKSSIGQGAEEAAGHYRNTDGKNVAPGTGR